jgi:hypothetical protein
MIIKKNKTLSNQLLSIFKYFIFFLVFCSIFLSIFDNYLNIDKIQECLNKTLDYLNDNSYKILNNDFHFFTDLITKYKEFLANLSLYELCLVINITSSLFILGCLVSIFFSFYGNVLITKLNLVEKYPKLANLIKLRIKVQHFYIIVNFVLIFIALFGLIYVNVSVFLQGN